MSLLLFRKVFSPSHTHTYTLTYKGEHINSLNTYMSKMSSDYWGQCCVICSFFLARKFHTIHSRREDMAVAPLAIVSGQSRAGEPVFLQFEKMLFYCFLCYFSIISMYSLLKSLLFSHIFFNFISYIFILLAIFLLP